MTDKIEQVARAIQKEHSSVEWRTLNDFAKDAWHRDARAAIEAMREPTEEMAQAGYQVAHGTYSDEGEIVWRAMIDAALK